jgi:hypothetical protein
MERYNDYPWSELVPGAYVEDASGMLWKLVEENPNVPGQFSAVASDGQSAILTQEPTKRVTAVVPGEDEALRHLADILGAKALEGQARCAPIPRNNSPVNRARLTSHLKLLHHVEVAPRTPWETLLMIHDASHVEHSAPYPHNHG